MKLVILPLFTTSAGNMVWADKPGFIVNESTSRIYDSGACSKWWGFPILQDIISSNGKVLMLFFLSSANTFASSIDLETMGPRTAYLASFTRELIVS